MKTHNIFQVSLLKTLGDTQAENDSINLVVVLWVPGRHIPQILDFYTILGYPTNLNLVTSMREAMPNITSSVTALTKLIKPFFI